MKSNTQKILSIIRDENYNTNIEKLPSILIEKQFSAVSYDISIEDIVEQYGRIKKFIVSKKGLVIIDSISRSKSKEIITNLEKSNDILQNFLEDGNLANIGNFTNCIENIFDILFIYFELSERGNYSTDAIEINNLKVECRKYKQELQSLLAHKDSVSKFIKDFDLLKIEMSGSKALVSHIRDMESEIDIKRANIQAFAQYADDIKVKIQGTITDSENKNAESTTFLALNNTLHTETSNKLKSLIDRVSEGALGQHFLEKTENGGRITFFAGTIFSLLCGIVAVILAFEHLNLTTIPDWGLLMLRLSIFAPFAVVAAICYNEYIFYRRLKEDYSFKSILSLSLHSFSNIITDHKDEGTKNFIQSSVNEIFKSPFEKITSKDLNEKILNRVIDSTINIGEKVSQKIID